MKDHDFVEKAKLITSSSLSELETKKQGQVGGVRRSSGRSIRSSHGRCSVLVDSR